MIAPTLHTERLTLRMPRLADFEPRAAFYASDRSVYEGGPKPRAAAWREWASDVGQWPLMGYGPFAVDIEQMLQAFRHDIGHLAVFRGRHAFVFVPVFVSDRNRIERYIPELAAQDAAHFFKDHIDPEIIRNTVTIIIEFVGKEIHRWQDQIDRSIMFTDELEEILCRQNAFASFRINSAVIVKVKNVFEHFTVGKDLLFGHRPTGIAK